MELRFPWEADTPPPAAGPAVEPEPSPESAPATTIPRGRRAVPAAEPGWRCHHLTVSGPAADVAAFAGAARGAGVTPWQLDLAALEEDVFNLAAARPAPPRRLTIAGCRILAAALVGGIRACPFDLHSLLPVPAILQLAQSIPRRWPGCRRSGAWLIGCAKSQNGRGRRPGGDCGRSRRGRLQLFHRRRDTACGDHRTRRPLAGAALRAASASVRLVRLTRGDFAAPAGADFTGDESRLDSV
jgi:hypothetical protein